MSSILGTGGTCGFNLDLIKCPSTSSTCSSTLSKSSSVSSLAITTKRARTPRKRPNQSYIEAAAILSAACPNVFSIKKLHEKHSRSLSSLSSSSLSSSDILPSFPVLNDSDFLIESPPRDPNPSFKFKRSFNPIGKSSAALRAISPPKSLDYDVDSIFDDEGGDGIDSIMGKLSMNDCDSNSASYPAINPCFGKFGLDYGFGQGQNNIRQLMRGVHDKDLGRPMAMVQMDDLVPKFNVLPPLGKKKTKKKKKKLDELNDDLKIIQTTTASRITTDTKLEGQVMSGLGLKLNLEEVIKAWGARGFPFSCEAGTEESSNEIAARLAEIGLSPSAESSFLRYLRAFQKPDKSIRCGGTREASLQRYREKRSTRHFTKKICYQVRKVNADCKPRMKGCFVKKNHSLHGAVGDEGQ